MSILVIRCDRRQETVECLNMVLNNETGALFLEFDWCEEIDIIGPLKKGNHSNVLPYDRQLSLWAGNNQTNRANPSTLVLQPQGSHVGWQNSFLYPYFFSHWFAWKKGFVHNLQKVSGKSGWKVNGTRLFGSFQLKISRSKGTPEKVVLFFRTDCCKRKFEFHFFKAIFDTSFRPSLPVFGKWKWIVRW